MQHERANGGSPIWRDWHVEREEARRSEMNEAFFGPIETERYDLDTAGITGEDNPETYRIEPYGATQESVDYREVDPRFD